LLLTLGALDATGYSVIVPVAPAIADATGAGPATIGLLVACFPAGMVIGFAAAGWAVERHGARAVLATSLVLVALGALGFILGSALAVYFPSRLLMGLGSGGIWIGVTFDTLERWPGQEYLCMSRIFAAYSVGGLIGPALGLFGGIHGPFIAYLGLLLAAVPLGLVPRRPGDQANLLCRPRGATHARLLARICCHLVCRARPWSARGGTSTALR
jgi:MFS family permease